MIDNELIRIATTPRECADRIRKETSEALAVYFEGESLARYIPEFPKEDPEKYMWRQSAVLENNDNYAKEIVEQYVEGIFRTRYPERITGDKWLDTWIYDDYQKWFSAKVAPFALLCPELYVKVSIPKPTAPILTRADQMEHQGLPKLSIVYPQNVINLSLGRDNEIEWIAIQNDDSEIVIYDCEEYVVIRAAKDGAVSGVESYTEIERDLHGFSRVPIVRFVHRENTSVDCSPKMGHAFMYNVIKKSLGALQFVSMLIEAGHYHLFPKLIMSEGTFKRIQKSGMGAGQPIVEDTDMQGKGDGSTRYLTMSNTELATIECILYERIPKAIYRAARLRDRSSERQQSGFSKAFDMVPEVAVLTQIAEFFYDCDRKILEILTEAVGGDASQIKLEYPTTFDTKSIAEIATETTGAIGALKDAGIPVTPTTQKLLAMNVLSQLFPDVTDDEWQKITCELEAALAVKPVVTEVVEQLGEEEPVA